MKKHHKRVATENEAQAAVGLLLNEGGKPLYLKRARAVTPSPCILKSLKKG